MVFDFCHMISPGDSGHRRSPLQVYYNIRHPNSWTSRIKIAIFKHVVGFNINFHPVLKRCRLRVCVDVVVLADGRWPLPVGSKPNGSMAAFGSVLAFLISKPYHFTCLISHILSVVSRWTWKNIDLSFSFCHTYNNWLTEIGVYTVQ